MTHTGSKPPANSVSFAAAGSAADASVSAMQIRRTFTRTSSTHRASAPPSAFGTFPRFAGEGNAELQSGPFPRLGEGNPELQSGPSPRLGEGNPELQSGPFPR